jgi:hypothetical protein
LGENCVDYAEGPEEEKVADGSSMDLVLFFGEEDDLGESEQGGKEGMISKEEIIEIDLSGLISIDEVSITAVDGVEGKSSEIHSDEIEVHALDARYMYMYLLCLKFS